MIDHHPGSERLSWNPIAQNCVVIKGTKWSGSGKILLKENESLIPNSIRIKPYWLLTMDNPTLIPHEERITVSRLMPIALENYL